MMFVWSEPSAFMTQMSRSPSRLLVKAIFVPSGDQLGYASSAEFLVSGLMPVPSAFMTQIS